MVEHPLLQEMLVDVEVGTGAKVELCPEKKRMSLLFAWLLQKGETVYESSQRPGV